MPASDLLHRIAAYNAGRLPDRLPLKYQAMSESAFRFFRATAHLFYEDLTADAPWTGHPLSWVCGDLHLENFGSYRGDNRLVYFDINDFDEALLAPCTCDVARMLTSVFVGASSLKLSRASARRLARHFADHYRQTLLTGKPRSVERDVATGALGYFLEKVAQRRRRDLVARHTKRKKKNAVLRLDNVHLAALDEAAKADLLHWLGHALGGPDGYEVLDVAYRVAGTSSLALPRYAVLAATSGGKQRLLDVKTALPSAAAPFIPVLQPAWPTEADRVVELQRRVQDVSPAFLRVLLRNGTSYVVRELQPMEDRLDLTSKSLRKDHQLLRLLETMAQLTASGHLRSAGRQGSAIADDFLAFAASPGWTEELLERADAYAGQVADDFRAFRRAYRAGWRGETGDGLR
jgi:uncharacterized protein (DUF2252 family)